MTFSENSDLLDKYESNVIIKLGVQQEKRKGLRLLFMRIYMMLKTLLIIYQVSMLQGVI